MVLHGNRFKLKHGLTVKHRHLCAKLEIPNPWPALTVDEFYTLWVLCTRDVYPLLPDERNHHGQDAAINKCGDKPRDHNFGSCLACRQPGPRCNTTMEPISQSKHGPNNRPPRFAHINHPVRRQQMPLLPRSYVRTGRPLKFPPDNRQAMCAVHNSHVVPGTACVITTRA